MSMPESGAQPPPRRVRRHRAASIVAGIGTAAVLALAVWALWPRPAAPSGERSATAEASSSPREAPLDAIPKATLPEPRLDDRGLPPRDSPWREQWAALETAAADGDARAACRLSFAAMSCAAVPSDDAEARAAINRRATLQQAQEADALGENRAAVLAAAPESLRDDLARWIDAAANDMAPGTTFSALAEQCKGLSPQDASRVLSWLRQAALGGHPEALAAYAHGMYAVHFMGLNAASSNDHGKEAGFHWIRSPDFRAWRREAPALRRAGLERGDLAMLRAEVALRHVGILERLAPHDPVESAAATRALALLALGSDVPSSSSLGLDPEAAARADLLSETWAAAAQRRGAPLGYTPQGMNGHAEAQADCP